MAPMSEVRRRTLIAAPPQAVWALLTDVERHPEWWPDVLETECEDFHEGCVYREVTKVPWPPSSASSWLRASRSRASSAFAA
jgi:uncharacterized protein YndB with AHSA1/START domain